MLAGTVDSTIGAFTDGFEQIVTLDGAGFGNDNLSLLGQD
jgi:hypothetical protein